MQERRRLFVLIVATAGAILVPLNTSMLSIGLAPIIHHYDIPVSSGAWLILLYLMIMTSLQPAAGKLGDRYGHRLIFLSGMVLFAAASAGAALAPTFDWLILFRVLQGLAGTTLAPNASALIRLVYPAERQGQAMGLYVGAFSVGLTVGPVISGLLIHSFGWQAIFWVNLPAVLIAVPLGLAVLPRATGTEAGGFDWWGSGLFTCLVSGAVLTVSLWQNGELPVPVWGALLALGVLGILFYLVEERAADPLLRLSLFRLPGFAAANAAIFLLHTVQYALMVAVPLYLQSGRGLSSTRSGLVMAIYSAMQVVVSPFSGRLSDQLGRRPLVAAGGLLYLVGSILLGSLPQAVSLGPVIAALVLGGVGTGLTSAPVQAACLEACPPEYVGVGAGVWYSSRYLGNITAALLVSLLLPANLALGGGLLYWTLAGVAALLILTARLMPAGRPAA